MNLYRLIPSVSLLAIAAGHANPAYAQANPAEPATVEQADQGQADQDQAADGIGEIVITAQKRAESLSRTAAAVSVVGQQTLDSVGARSFADAVSTMPNVSANGLGSTIAIRGLGTNTLGAGNGTVAFHVDGIFQQSGNQSGATLYDIARVEVLRGPQGTLYGRNATAGVVNVITNNANTEKLEAFGDVSYGRWNTLAVRGVVNLPISDAFAVRLTGTYEKSDDWMRLADGGHARWDDILNLRLAWRVKPSDNITWDARVSYTRDNSLQVPVAVPTYRYDADTDTFIRASNSRKIATLPPGTGTDGLAFLGLMGLIPSVYEGLSFAEANRQNTRGLAFRSNLNIELSDELSLTYLLGYAREKDPPGRISGLQPFQVNYAYPSKDKSWSHEINLNYDSERVKAILGVYSFQNSFKQGDQLVRIFQPSFDDDNFIQYDLPLLEAGLAGASGMDRTRAIFGQATFDVTEQFRVTAGARYNWDRASFDSFSQSQCPFGSGLSGKEPNVAPAPAFLGPLAALPLCSAAELGVFAAFDPTFGPGFFYTNRTFPGGSKRFTKFSWKGTVEYDLAPTTMFYATVATGYKAGGTGDDTAIGDARFYRPETNINYEAGIRSRLFNNKLSLNLTGFWTDYKDLQIETTDPDQPSELVQINAGKSRSRGVEFEYVWAPTSADRISGYVSYLDAKFTKFAGQDTLTGQPADFKGNRLPGAPEFSARISYSHIFDLGSAGTITPTASFFYQTKTYVSFLNSLPTKIPSYTRSDFIVRYETANKRFSLEAFVNNIEDKILMSEMFPLDGFSTAFFAPPRSYGVRLGFRY